MYFYNQAFVTFWVLFTFSWGYNLAVYIKLQEMSKEKCIYNKMLYKMYFYCYNTENVGDFEKTHLLKCFF